MPTISNRLTRLKMKVDYSVLLDRDLYPNDTWKRAAYVIIGVHPSYREELESVVRHGGGNLALLNCLKPLLIPLHWQDAAYEIAKFFMRQEPDMSTFLPEISEQEVHNIASSIAATEAIFWFLRQKMLQENDKFNSKLRFPFRKHGHQRPLLPLPPLEAPYLPSMPEDDERPAWYTANYVARMLLGHITEESSDGWEFYLASKQYDHVEEKRD